MSKETLKAAHSNIQKGNFELALGQCTEFLDSRGFNANAAAIQGRCLEELGRHDEAIDCAMGALQQKSVTDGMKPYFYQLICRNAIKTSKMKLATDSFLTLVELSMKLDNEDFQQTLKALFYSIIKAGNKETMNDMWKIMYTHQDVFRSQQTLSQVFNLQIRHYAAEVLRTVNQQVKKSEARFKFNISASKKQIAEASIKIYKNSAIEEILRTAIDCDISSEYRRKYEQALLDIYLAQMSALDDKDRPEKAKSILSFVENMLLFEPSGPEPFFIFWDWSDLQSLSDFKETDVTKFMQLFPSNGLTAIFDAILHSSACPFSFSIKDSKETNKNQKKGAKNSPSIWSTQMVVDELESGFSLCPNSLTAIRLMAHFYHAAELYKKALTITESGSELIETIREKYGLQLSNTKLELETIDGLCTIGAGQARDLGKLEQTLTAALEANPDNRQAASTRAAVLIQLGRLSEALHVLRDLSEKDPNDPQALSDLGWCYIKDGSLDDGVSALQKARTLFLSIGNAFTGSKAALTIWRLGHALWLKKDLNDAVSRFSECLHYDPSFAPAFNSIGLVYDTLGDSGRALRYFHKALELDNSQIDAASHLARSFAEDGLWDLVGIVATRVAGAGIKDNGDQESSAWSARALGLSVLAQGRYSEAIEHLQKSLRLDAHDSSLWIGLGESYLRVGRFKSASKALMNALKIDPNSAPAHYHLGLTLRASGQYDDAILSIEKSIDLLGSPQSESALLCELIKTMIMAADFEIATGYFGNAREHLSRALSLAQQGVEVKKENTTLLLLLAQVASTIGAFSTQTSVESLLKATQEKIQQAGLSDSSEFKYSTKQLSAWLSNICARSAIKTSNKSKAMKSISHYNLALSQCIEKSRSSDFSTCNDSFENARTAIKLEPRNSNFWELYGVLLSDVNPRAAQHSFAQALIVDPYSSRLWANASAFYYLNGDRDLASECTDRALTLNPYNSNAWAISAIIELGLGKAQKAQDLLEQAFEMAPDSESFTNTLYGSSELEKMFDKESASVNFTTLVALQKAVRQRPNDKTAMRWYADLLERAGCYSNAISVVDSLLVLDTDNLSLRGQLSRLYLGLKNWEEARKYSQELLLTEEDVEESDVLCALLVNGLASFYLGDHENAKEMIQTAQDYSEAGQDVAYILTAVLYACDSSGGLDSALEQCFESLNTFGASVKQTLLIGLLAVKGENKELLQVVQQDLSGLQLGDMSSSEVYLSQSLQSRIDGNSKYPFYRGLLYHPDSYSLWKKVCPEQALRVKATKSESCADLSEAYCNVGTLRDLQRAIFYDPSSNVAWRKFTEISV